jgi:ABC-type polysaccharide/polyol phosphate transport system ATPase subunit
VSAAIELQGAGKRYWKFQEQAMLMKSLLPGMGARKSEFWALRDVSFSVEAGETVGILGRNGAGKTTMLRMLAGVSRPSEGRVVVRGRVAPLLSVGVGFHQEMSGRENVFVNGLLLGLTRQQVAQRFDEIVEFAELSSFIDTPVKFYSSGQYLRLGFAVAVHVDPDVLLVDEVLAVGDLAFQLKCFERMRKLQASGTTILLVSHSVHAIRLLCPRALLFREGHLEMDARADQCIARYHEMLSLDQIPAHARLDGGAGPVSVVSSQVERANGEPTHHPDPGEPLRYRATLRFNQPVHSPHLVFRVTSEEGIPCYTMQSKLGHDWRGFEAGETVEVEVPFSARLGGGTYRLSISIADRTARDFLASDVGEVIIYLAPRLGSTGFVDLEASIHACGHDLTLHDSLLLGGASVGGAGVGGAGVGGAGVAEPGEAG